MKKNITTQVGVAKVIRQEPTRGGYKCLISCPIGRGECWFDWTDVNSRGRFMCPYCKKQNILLQEKSTMDAIVEQARRDAIRRPKRSEVHNSSRWTTIRYAVLKRDKGRCVLCGRSAEDGIKLHVDHIKPVSIYPELYYDINNLQTLCSDCNIGKSDSDSINWRKK